MSDLISRIDAGHSEILSRVVIIGLVALLLAHPAFVARASVYTAVVLATGVVWTIALLVRKKEILQELFLPRGARLAVLAWIGFSVLSAVVHTRLEWTEVFFLLSQVLFLLVGWQLAGSTALGRRFASVAVLGGGIVSGYGLLQFYHLDPLPRQVSYALLRRVIGSFENPNHFGNYLACVLPLELAAFFRTVSRSAKAGWYTLCGLLYTALLLTGSRGAWGAAFAGGLVVLFGSGLQFRRGGMFPRWALHVLALMGLFVGITLWFGGETVVRTPEGAVSVAERLLSSGQIVAGEAAKDGSIHHRYAVWRVSLAMIGQNPWLGQGIGAYARRFVDFRKVLQAEGRLPAAWPPDGDVAYAHNAFLHVGSESGILALLGFVGVIGTHLVHAIRSVWRAPARRIELWGLVGLVTAMLVHSLVDYPLHLELNGMVFWMTLGMASRG